MKVWQVCDIQTDPLRQMIVMTMFIMSFIPDPLSTVSYEETFLQAKASEFLKKCFNDTTCIYMEHG